MKRKRSIDIDEMLNDASEDSDADSDASGDKDMMKKTSINNSNDRPISKIR